MLASLEGTSMKAQQALERGTHVNLAEAANLNAYFQKVRAERLCFFPQALLACLPRAAEMAAGWRAAEGSVAARAHTLRRCRCSPSPDTTPQVRVTMGKFEERLWSIIRNFLAVSQEDPALLVTALQVGGAGVAGSWGPGGRGPVCCTASAGVCGLLAYLPALHPHPPSPPHLACAAAAVATRVGG